MSLSDCRIVELTEIRDERGCLCFMEGDKEVPFPIKRIYYLYDIPSLKQRGAHGHKALEQVIIAVHGEFELILDDGVKQKTYVLSRPNQGVYVCPMIWREVQGFHPHSVCLVLASERYDATDYIRDYDEFLRLAKGTP